MHKLAIIFLLGLLAFLLPFGPSISNSNAMAFENYGYGYESDQYYERYAMDMANDNYYKSKNSDFIKKIKCINSNLNINGNNNGNVSIGNKGQGAAAEQGYLGDYSSASSGYDSGGYDGYNNNKQGKGFDCIINNNNNNTNVVTVGGNVTTPPTEDETTLSVSKTVSCIPQVTSLQFICDAIEQGIGNPEFQITPDEFTIQVTGTNPISSTFNGSTTPVVVTLDPGNYEVTETVKASVQETITAIEATNVPVRLGVPVFTGDCVQDVMDRDTATGTIAAGESQTCNKDNRFGVG
jgi:hypothetical protein